MCGIYGILNLDGRPADTELLSGMADLNLHRGPDDEGIYAEGPCVIGMRRLSIIDLMGGHQPLSNAEKTIWLVANGEIYNFRELRSDLEKRGHRFVSASDCEAIIHAYAEYGDDFVHHLNGMFAFALWDRQSRRLVLGRDRLGIKPIYFYRDTRRLIFASEAKAILAAPGISTSLDYRSVGAYLNLGYVPAPYSIFDGIRKIQPATLLIAQGDRIQQRRYWSMPNEIDSSLKEEEWFDLVRKCLEESVRMQMLSDVPIGAFLSGGIDSSSVVAFMARASNRRVKTYAIGFAGGNAAEFYNELPYARRVAELFGTEHHEIVVQPDVIKLLPKLLWHMDEPIADSAFITTFLVSEFARRDATVILSGVGGDELFGGYRRYLGSFYQPYYDALPQWTRRAANWLGDRLPSDRHSRTLNTLRYAKSFIAAAALPFEGRYRAYVEVFSSEAVRELTRYHNHLRSDALDCAFNQASSSDPLNRLLAVDAETQLPDDLLLLTDKMSMATSLECRVPLLNHELVELVARIPQSIKIRGGRLKHVMKGALKDILPPDILDRKKRGFGAPIGAWLKGDLEPLLHGVLSESSVAKRGLFHYNPICELIHAHEHSRLDGTDRLLGLVNLEIWCRMYLDNRDQTDVALELCEAIEVQRPRSSWEAQL